MDWVDRLRQAVDATDKQYVVAADAGVDPSTLSDILNRYTAPRLQTIIDLCRVCGVTVGWLLGEEGFELGEEDFAKLTAIHAWTGEKLEQKRERGASKLRALKPLPAVATPHGETFFDPDEIQDREIPLVYQNDGANGVFITRGDSMIDAGILDGDILFVRKTRNYRTANKEIVVCRLDGTFTVKRLVVDVNAMTLISEKAGEPVVTINEDAERFELIGIVVGLERDFMIRR